jgi:MoaD family protein
MRIVVRTVLVLFKSFGTIRRVLQKQLLELDMPEGSTVRDVIDEVVSIGGPPLRRIVLHEGEVSGNLIVLLNRRDVRTLDGEFSVQVSEGDMVSLLPHVQGG